MAPGAALPSRLPRGIGQEDLSPLSSRRVIQVDVDQTATGFSDEDAEVAPELVVRGEFLGRSRLLLPSFSKDAFGPGLDHDRSEPLTAVVLGPIGHGLLMLLFRCDGCRHVHFSYPETCDPVPSAEGVVFSSSSSSCFGSSTSRSKMTYDLPPFLDSPYPVTVIVTLWPVPGLISSHFFSRTA